jgi:hypothetical protein
MLQYLRDEIDRLTGFKLGITKYPDKWANNEVTEADIKTSIDSLEAAEKQIEEIKNLLSQKQIEAKALKTHAVKLGDKVENFINGYHAGEPQKLIDYGLEPKKQYVKKQAPSTKLLITIQDDTDGVGFILTTTADPDAEMYEWQKGLGTDAAKIDIIPTMTLLKTTKKISFVDDEVPKGVRVFYKVRGVNGKGDGPWSEAVSRVQ